MSAAECWLLPVLPGWVAGEEWGGIHSFSLSLVSSAGTATPIPGDKGTVLAASTALFTLVGGGRTDQGLAACPLPRRWLKDGHPLDGQEGVVLSEDGGTLLVTRVGLGHQGLYICQGSNWAGLAQAEVQVSVHGECSIWGETCCPSPALGRMWLPKWGGSSWPRFLVGAGSLA